MKEYYLLSGYFIGLIMLFGGLYAVELYYPMPIIVPVVTFSGIGLLGVVTLLSATFPDNEVNKIKWRDVGLAIFIVLTLFVVERKISEYLVYLKWC